MATAAILYTLITVTYGGSVGHSQGYTALSLCQEARSLALTGETIEAYKATDEAIADAAKKANEKWREAHPPRAPKDEHERAFVAGGGSYADTSGNAMHVSGGLIYDDPPYYAGLSQSFYLDQGEAIIWQHGTSVIKRREDVKVAECVIETTP